MNDHAIRILHVEDNPGDARLVREMLADAKSADYDLVQVARLQEALVALASDRIDVVLADLGLPDSVGLETVKQILGAAPEMPVIVMSGSSDEMLAIQAVQAGAQDYLVKGKLDGYLLTRAIQYAIERKHAQDALRASEQRYRSLVENASDLTLLIDADAAIRYCSPAAERILGYRVDQVLGRNVYEFVHPDDVKNAANALAYRLAHPDVPAETMELRARHMDGAWRLLEGRGDNFVANMAVGGIVLNFHDVTERKQRERELEAVAAASAALRTARTRAEMLPVILDQLMALLDGQAALVASRDSSTGETVIELARGSASAFNGMRILPARGIFGHVIGTGRPYVTDDIRADPLSPRPDQLGMSRVAAFAPLIAYEETIGAIAIARNEKDSTFPPRFTQSDLRVLNAIADIAANAIQRETAHEQTVKHLNRLRALHTIDLAITSTYDLRVMLAVLLDQVTSQLGIDAADVLLLNDQSQTLEYTVGKGFRTTAFRNRQIRIGDAYAGRAALEKRRIIIQDWRNEITDSANVQSLVAGLRAEEFVALGVVPLNAKGRLVGVLEVFQRSPLAPDEDWLDYLDALAGQAAIATENIHLIESLQRANFELTDSYDATLEGWSRALELRDKETEGHTFRVAEIAEHLARAMGMPDAQLVNVRRGALLHDIGKIAIADRILLKPGPLTDSEWVIMRQHPIFAYQVLSPIAYLRPALDIPYCHHEKWDGTGYPRGLRGEEIPLAARIFAIVDVWDALRSNRPYRPAWPEEKAREYLRAQAGIHFDPQVVAEFLHLLEAEGTC